MNYLWVVIMNKHIISNRFKCLTALAAAPLLAMSVSSYADMDAAKRWVDNEFNESTLTKDQQMKEMDFFINASKPFKGMDIKVVSETIATHVYESDVLAKAFTEITGIKIKHVLTGEGDVIQKLQHQMYTGENLFDAYINDSDLIGTHYRYGEVLPVSDFMVGEGADVTLPTLDIQDFIGIKFTTGLDDKIYQLPDQQFANLYWFRQDWFERKDLQDKFKKEYVSKLTRTPHKTRRPF